MVVTKQQSPGQYHHAALYVDTNCPVRTQSPYHQHWHHSQRKLPITKISFVLCLYYRVFFYFHIVTTKIHVKYDTYLGISQFSTSLVKILCRNVPVSLVLKYDHSTINKKQWWTCVMKTIRIPKLPSMLLLQHQAFHIIWIIYCINSRSTLMEILTECFEFITKKQRRLHQHLLDIYFL
jgi:hypothetical protein